MNKVFQKLIFSGIGVSGITLIGICLSWETEEKRYRSKMPQYRTTAQTIRSFISSFSPENDLEVEVMDPESNWWFERFNILNEGGGLYSFSSRGRSSWKGFLDECFSKMESNKEDFKNNVYSNLVKDSESELPPEKLFWETCLSKKTKEIN